MRTTVITKSLSKTAVDFYRPSAVSFNDLFCGLLPGCLLRDITLILFESLYMFIFTLWPFCPKASSSNASLPGLIVSLPGLFSSMVNRLKSEK